MKKKDLNRILAWISQALTCPVCESKYTSENTRLVDSKRDKVDEGMVTIHSDCKYCRSSVVFNVTMLGHEIFSIGVLSDLTALDAIRMRQAKPMTADDLISLHTYMQTFDGNFEKILSR